MQLKDRLLIDGEIDTDTVQTGELGCSGEVCFVHDAEGMVRNQTEMLS